MKNPRSSYVLQKDKQIKHLSLVMKERKYNIHFYKKFFSDRFYMVKYDYRSLFVDRTKWLLKPNILRKCHIVHKHQSYIMSLWLQRMCYLSLDMSQQRLSHGESKSITRHKMLDCNVHSCLNKKEKNVNINKKMWCKC